MAPGPARRPLTVIGAPTSAGSYAAGQESAPRVLREHGLLEQLRSRGRRVADVGDGPLQVWAPDRAHPFAQNFEAAAEAIRAVAVMVGDALDDDADVLVLGGNCTIALGVMSALIAREAQSALVYIDRHFDLNTPTSTTDGALDWMGLACAFDLLPDPPDFGFPRVPLLAAEQLLYVGADPTPATEWEVQQVENFGLTWRSNDALATDPDCEATAIQSWVRRRQFALHLDLDVLDFTDLPLAENTDGRNSGPSLDAMTKVLAVGCADPGFRVLSIGELNPTRADGTPDAIPRFIDALVTALA
ncbi:MAG TPA: arginase family protein [Galbitalea sp.]